MSKPLAHGLEVYACGEQGRGAGMAGHVQAEGVRQFGGFAYRPVDVPNLALMQRLAGRVRKLRELGPSTAYFFISSSKNCLRGSGPTLEIPIASFGPIKRTTISVSGS